MKNQQIQVLQYCQKKKYYTEARNRSEKNVDRRDDVSKWRSVMRKLNNEIRAIEESEKKKGLT